MFSIQSVSACLLMLGWMSEGAWEGACPQVKFLFSGTLTIQNGAGPDWVKYSNKVNHIFQQGQMLKSLFFVTRFY